MADAFTLPSQQGGSPTQTKLKGYVSQFAQVDLAGQWKAQETAQRQNASVAKLKTIDKLSANERRDTLREAVKLGVIDKRKAAGIESEVLKNQAPIKPNYNLGEKLVLGGANVGKAVATPFVKTGKKVGEQISNLTDTSSKGPGADNIMKWQTGAQKALESGKYSKQFKDSLNGTTVGGNIEVMRMLSEGKPEKEIKTFLDKNKSTKSANDKEMFGTAAELASFGFGGGATTKAIESGGKALVKPIAEGVGAGVLGGTGNVASTNPNATKEDYLKGGIIGGIVGGAVPAIGEALPAVVRQGLDKIPSVHAADDVITTGSMSSTARARASLSEAPKILAKDLLDKNQPVKDLVGEVQQILGRKLKQEDNPHELLKLRAGVEGQVVTHLQQTGSWMKDVPKALRADGDAYNYAKQFISQKAKRTPEQIKTAENTIKKLEAKYGGDVSKLEAYGAKTRESFDSLVSLYHDNGLISDATAKKLAANPDYFAKMEVLQDETGIRMGAGGSVNTREVKGFQGVKGQANGARLAHSSEAYVAQTLRAFKDIANNKVGKAFGALADETEGKQGLVIRLRSTDNVLGRDEIYGQLKKSKVYRDSLIKMVREHKDAIRGLASEVKNLEKTGQKALIEKSDQVRNAVVKAANGGAALPGTGSKLAKLPSSQQEIEAFVHAWIKSDKSGLKGLVDRLSEKNQKVKDLKGDLETLESHLSRELTSRKSLWDTAQGLKDAELPKGYTRISYLDKGVRNEIALPKEIGDILTNANPEQFDRITGLVGKITNVFRQSVTTYNPLFTFFRNPIRDFKSFLTNSRYVPVHKAVTQYSSALMDSVTNGRWTKEFLSAGGGQAGYFAREGGQAGKAIAKQAKELTGKRTVAGRIITSPRDFMQFFSSAVEQAPRVAEYKAARKAGQSMESAAVAGREVTVDFAQGGDLAKVANQWVPFLNARMQGIRRTVQAFKEDPKRALTVYAATTALPMAALMSWNKEHFGDVWQNLSPADKGNNFMFIYGDHKDASGRYTDVVKIPKGDVDKILGNTFETMLDQFTQKGGSPSSKVAGSVLDALSNFSPVGFSREGKFSGGELLGGVTPSIIKEPVQQLANYDLYRGEAIVPDKMLADDPSQQVQANTSNIAKRVGAITHQSPLRVEHAINAFGGSVPADISGGPKGTAERNLRGVVGASGNNVENKFYTVYNPLRDTGYAKQRQINGLIYDGKTAQAERIANKWNETVDKRFSDYYKQYGDLADPDYKERIGNLKIEIKVSKKGRPYIER